MVVRARTAPSASQERLRQKGRVVLQFQKLNVEQSAGHAER